MNCKQTEQLLPLYAGCDLEETRATLVTEHLQTCSACARVADEYRESVQLIEQFAPPTFSEAVYAGIRSRVLRETETEPTALPQTIANFFRPGLSWAMAAVLLLLVSMFAIYFIVNRANDEQHLANQPPATLQHETKKPANPERQDDQQSELSSLVQPAKKQQLTRVPESRRKRSPQPDSLPEPMLFPPHDSAALVKTLRVEIQTKDPKIRIIWFVQPETKPVIPSSKGI